MHNLNITVILAIWLAGSIVALPLLAFTARFGLVPLVEAVAEVRSAGRAPLLPHAAELRIAGIEHGLAALTATVERIAQTRIAALPYPAAAHLPGSHATHIAANLLGGDSQLAVMVDDGHPAH